MCVCVGGWCECVGRTQGGGVGAHVCVTYVLETSQVPMVTVKDEAEDTTFYIINFISTITCALI